MLPLFSPASSVVVYIFGKTCWAAKASESNSPPLTRSRTFSSKLQQKFVALPLDQQIERRQDRQTRLDQGQELLVENQKRGLLAACPGCPNFPPPALSMVSGLNPVDQIALLREAVVDLGFGIAVLHLLPQVALFVGDFDQEFCHYLSHPRFRSCWGAGYLR
jgi:hypothetical protein